MQVEENTMNQFMTTSKSINNENKENMKGSTSSNTPPILLKYKGQNYFLFHKFTNTSQQQEEYQVILPNRDSLFTSDKLNTLMEELSQIFNIQNDVFLFFGNPISLRFGINITYSQELTLSDIAALYFGLRTNSDPFIVELQEDSSNFFREYNALVEKSQEKERSNNVNSSFSSKLEVQEDLNELQEEESSVTTNQTNLNQSSNIIEKEEEEQEDDEVNNFAIVDQNEEEQETVAGTSSSSLVNPSEEVEQQEQNNNEDNEEGDAGLNTESEDHVTGDITAADLDEGFVSVADNEGEEDADNAQQLNSDEINQLQSEQQVEDATEYIEAADEMQVDEVQSQVQLSQSQQQQPQLNSFENSNSQLESILTKSTSNNAIESTSSSSFINAAQTQATDSTTEDQNSLANVEEEVEEQEDESTKSNAKKREREDSSNGYSSQEDILIDANGNYLETELNDNRYYEPAFKRQKVEATI